MTLRHLPGLALAVLIAATSRLASLALPSLLPEILVAVLLGIVVANARPLPASAGPGIRFAVERILRLGIVLLGARLSLAAILAIGVSALGLVLVSMAVALGMALIAGRQLRLQPRLALLIGVGTAVCGNSAIVATAPVVNAEEREVSFAVATITLFGTLAVFLFPLVGRALGLGDSAFGVWSGVAVNDTSQVVAASAAFSPAARDVATVVKLVRNALMAPLIVLIAWWWRSRSGGASVATLRSAVPLFVLGFLAMALLRSAGAISVDLAAVLDEVAKACILIALSGVGLNTRVAELRSVGPAPFALGLAVAVVIATLDLIAVVALRIAPAHP